MHNFSNINMREGVMDLVRTFLVSPAVGLVTNASLCSGPA